MKRSSFALATAAAAALAATAPVAAARAQDVASKASTNAAPGKAHVVSCAISPQPSRQTSRSR